MTTKKAARTGKNKLRGGGAAGSRTRTVPKKTERRAGDKSTRARSGGQKDRHASLAEAPERVSGLARKRPVRKQRLVEDQRKGQTPSHTGASRRRGRGG
jgi:hypothetical protein